MRLHVGPRGERPCRRLSSPTSPSSRLVTACDRGTRTYSDATSICDDRRWWTWDPQQCIGQEYRRDVARSSRARTLHLASSPLSQPSPAHELALPDREPPRPGVLVSLACRRVT